MFIFLIGSESLLGVFKTAKDRGADIVYGMVHGIKGLLDGDVVDLSTQIKNDLDMDLLKRTPSSFLGSCRYKLPAIEGNEKTYDKIFATLKKLDSHSRFRGRQGCRRHVRNPRAYSLYPSAYSVGNYSALG